LTAKPWLLHPHLQPINKALRSNAASAAKQLLSGQVRTLFGMAMQAPAFANDVIVHVCQRLHDDHERC